MRNKLKSRIEIYLPIVPDFKFEKYPFEQKEYIIDEIRNVIKSAGFVEEDHIGRYQIDISVNEENNSQRIHNPFKPYLSGIKEEYLNFSILAYIDLDKFFVTSNESGSWKRITDRKALLTCLPYSLSDTFGDKIFEILILSQIARPGSLKLRDGVIWIDDERQSKIIPSIVNLREPLEHYFERKYPNIQFINFCDYYSWLKTNDLIFNITCKNAYQKAINFFSHLNGNSSIMNDIIFPMVTLEQLYTDSIHQISEQLDRNIQIYLGSMNSYKKQIKNMYNIRSRLLHGDMPILPVHKELDVNGNFPKHETELFEAYKISVLLVIATLQKMYKDNLLNLHFEYKLTKHNNK